MGRLAMLAKMLICTQVLGCSKSIRPHMNSQPSNTPNSGTALPPIPANQPGVFTLTLPSETDLATVRGLDVIVHATNVQSTEALYIDLSVPGYRAAALSEIDNVIASYTVYRPLQEGQSLIVSIGAPPRGAWHQTEKGLELPLRALVRPAYSPGDRPEITVTVVAAEAILK